MMMPLGEAFYRGRVAALQAAIAESQLEGLLLLDAYNVVYASGFVHSPNERPIGLYIPVDGEPVLFIPLLEQENAAATWIGDIRIYFEFPGEEDAILWMLREIGAKRIGMDQIPYHVAQLGSTQISLSHLAMQQRSIKTDEELALVDTAAGYADYCLQQLLANAGEIIRAGGTELDILQNCMSATLERMQREVGQKYGRSGIRVTGTVHTGPRAALPHGETMDRKPQPGETLIAGIGAMVGGYHAESGATFVVGHADADTMRCLQAAMDCDKAGVNALRPGAHCAQVNDAALQVLKDYGLESAIRHRIGHGMGLQGHEAPWLAPGDMTLLKPDMVFSNEPGIYRPGHDGYRTINTMIVTNGEARVASRFLAEHPPEKRILAI